jgi:SAM-dependent methyltransferase
VLRTLKELMRGRSRTPQNTDRFIKSISPKAERPRVLVIGGGVPGRGTEALYSHPQIDLVCTDIYVTPDTVALADGHALPFKSESFDGVWIQAVLEHVLEPQRVVDEIHRVLKPEGIVYAQTPFMAQVHEAAYDFTRFTVSGHRWLFRRFSEINAGIARGPGTVLTWSVRYFVAAVFRSYRVGTVAAFLVSWVQFFDRFVDPKFAWDGPSGTFFLGRKSERAITRQEIIKFYKGAQ